jgi:hypothetical protein
MAITHKAGARPEKWQIHKARRCEAHWIRPRGRIASKCRVCIRRSRHSPHHRSQHGAGNSTICGGCIDLAPHLAFAYLVHPTARRTRVYNSTMHDLALSHKHSPLEIFDETSLRAVYFAPPSTPRARRSFFIPRLYLSDDWVRGTRTSPQG